MTGGEAGDVERCRPVFETFAEAVIQVGPLGSGQLAKLLNNLVFMAQVNLANDTFAFADRLGLDRAAFANVLAHGSGGSRAAATLAGLGFDATGISQAAPLLAKDLDIILDVARTAATDAPPALVELARRTLATLRGDA
jgi:3-hydroxyisobutyrate dehydrogenase-like beta-hydroxyacid dehydrogenase